MLSLYALTVLAIAAQSFAGVDAAAIPKRQGLPFQVGGGPFNGIVPPSPGFEVTSLPSSGSNGTTPTFAGTPNATLPDSENMTAHPFPTFNSTVLPFYFPSDVASPVAVGSSEALPSLPTDISSDPISTDVPTDTPPTNTPADPTPTDLSANPTSTDVSVGPAPTNLSTNPLPTNIPTDFLSTDSPAIPTDTVGTDF